MIFVLAILGGFVLRLLLSGSWRDIAQMRMRGEAAFFSVLVAVAIFPVLAGSIGPLRVFVIPTWLVLMAVLLLLCTWNVGVSRGFVAVAAGVASNLTVIAVNHGMPVAQTAARQAGGGAAVAVVQAGNLFHSAVGSGTRLVLLGDILPLPGWHGLRGILSVGDVLMLVGVLVVVATGRQDEAAKARSGVAMMQD